MSCAFSNDGLSWDREKALTGIVANGYHVVCGLESPSLMRVLYWNPDVPNQPYNMAGLRTAVCNPSVDPSVFTEDALCTGNLVTGGSQQVWNRGHYGPSFLWFNPAPTSILDKPFTWRYAMLFIASTGGNDSMGLGYSDDGLVWKLHGSAPVLSGLINPQPWEGVVQHGSEWRDLAEAHGDGLEIEKRGRFGAHGPGIVQAGESSLWLASRPSKYSSRIRPERLAFPSEQSVYVF